MNLDLRRSTILESIKSVLLSLQTRNNKRIGELKNIVNCIEGLGEIFAEVEGSVNSLGFRTLKEEIGNIQNDPAYQNLVRELPDLLSKLRTCASITIGVNLDASLQPVQAALLSVNEDPFTEQSILNKLFGIRKDHEGIAPLHTVPLTRTGKPCGCSQ